MITATTPKGERRRQALVAAAAELLLEGGFDAVRHRSVATRAELPLASTTYYFESLEDLIARAVEFSGNAELEAMRRRIGEVTHRRRGAEATVDLVLDLLIGPEGVDEGARGRLIARYERTVASARHPELREVQLRLRGQLDELLSDVLRRSDRIVRPEQLRRLVAVVDGAVVAALSESDPQPRRLARGALLEVIDIVAPATHQPVDRYRSLD
ncbi:TetR/AcrR family transcriptional regulator [Nocardia jinanensis]|uniref:Transcription regulator, TetR family protein n=1 Tax=Nocardia jinanensis TaxID=382504 RepID=A0A917RSC8_9NOCA|nr:TetR family transcriptional regulator [Nocardia jinanensis]GGL21953.1 putative transcription regulator, TetR family protein [Nocardia jinanensis]